MNTTANHADKLGHDDKQLSKSWQSILITLLFVFVVGAFTVRFTNQSPARPIYIESSNLTMPEYEALSVVIGEVGEVPFFESNLHQIHNKIATLSWVERVKVSRDWHRGIVVSVTPRRAIANFGSQELIDASGVVFVPVDKNSVMNPALITLYGPVNETWHIMQQVQYVNEQFSSLGITVSDLTLTPRQTWVIRFHNGLRVVVDNENTEQKIHQLAKVLKNQFFARLHEIQSVDLRYKNGFAISWQVGRQ